MSYIHLLSEFTSYYIGGFLRSPRSFIEKKKKERQLSCCMTPVPLQRKLFVVFSHPLFRFLYFLEGVQILCSTMLNTPAYKSEDLWQYLVQQRAKGFQFVFVCLYKHG